MYNLKCDEKYDSNLKIPHFSMRYSNVVNSDKINILIIKHEFDASTFRYRGYNIIQTMKNNMKYNIECFLNTELDPLYNILDKIHLVILQRANWSFELENFVTVLKNNNIKVLFDIDDLIYNPIYVPKYINSTGIMSEDKINYYLWYSCKLKLMANLSDGFIVTTESLCEKVKRDFNKPVWIFHNYLNLEQEKVAEKIIAIKDETYSNEKFIIGYFSGSRSHKRDLEIAEQALIKLMDEYDDIYLKIVGLLELSPELRKYEDKGRILFTDKVSFEELEYEIAKVDLNIVPLQKHEFNDCKSELKYFEASIVNTLTCATDNNVYKSVINEGVDGFLSDELSWFEKIEHIYLNFDELKDIADNARIKCLNEYCSKNQEKGLEKMYDDIFNLMV